MKCYALRSKINKGYLPVGKETTYKEPIDTDIVPRLFKSKHAAKCALIAWCAGEWYYNFLVEDRAYCGELKYNPYPDRKIEDMETVEINIP